MYVLLGMKLIKGHRILEFKQLEWLKCYIDFNTNKKKIAVSSFGKYFFKLIINSIFGKTMENVREKICFILGNNSNDYQKYVSKPSFISQKIFSKIFVAIHEIKLVLTLNKPRKYNAKLLFTNKDSLVYKIETSDVYEDFYEDKNFFDFNDYPKDLTFFDPVDRKVAGKINDDVKGKIICGFAGLKSKMYSFNDVDNEKKNEKSNKVSKNVVKNMNYQEYIDVLFDEKK